MWINVKYIKVKVGHKDDDMDDHDHDWDKDDHDKDKCSKDDDNKDKDDVSSFTGKDNDDRDADDIEANKRWDDDDFDNDDHDLDDDGPSCKADEILIAKDLGLIEMGALSKNFEKTIQAKMKDIQLPRGKEIKSVRVVTYHTGNYVNKGCMKVCDLRVPSGCHSGVKFHAKPTFTLDNGKTYIIMFDWDPDKDVKMQIKKKGEVKCKLHPEYDLLEMLGSGAGGSSPNK